MRIIGNLQLFEGDNSGSVVVQNTTSNTIVATMNTDTNGWFEILDLPDHTELKFYGFSGKEISQEDAVASISSGFDGYVGLFQMNDNPGLGIYLNAASTLMSLHYDQNKALTAKELSEKTKNYLFSEAFAEFAPGYTADFITCLAPKPVFDQRKFITQAKAHGSILSYTKSLITNNNVTDVTTSETFPFANDVEENSDHNENHAILDTSNSTAPTIPTAPGCSWGNNDVNWGPILGLQGNLSNTMENFTNMADAMAYMSTQSSSSSDTVADIGAGETLGSIGSWAAGGASKAATSYIFGHALSMAMDWIFNKKSATTRIIDRLKDIQGALSNISTQLNGIISLQYKEMKDLSEIMSGIDNSILTTISGNLTAPVSEVQSAYQTLYNHLHTKNGHPPSTIKRLAEGFEGTGQYALNTNVNAINDVFTKSYNVSSGSSTYPAALLSCITDGHILLSNENCYGFVQKLYAHYAVLQAQGTMMYIAGHNYLMNESNFSVLPATPSAKSIAKVQEDNLAVELKISSTGINYYNETILGGTSSPVMKDQITLFRQTFSPYFNILLGYVSDTLSTDMCIGFIPQVANQSATLFYHQPTNLIIYGFVSAKVRRWYSGEIENSLGTIPSSLTSWVYPSTAQYNSILAGFPATGQTLTCEYLSAHGIVFSPDSSPEGLAALWTNEIQNFAGQGFNTHIPIRYGRSTPPMPSIESLPIMATGAPVNPDSFTRTTGGEFGMWEFVIGGPSPFGKGYQNGQVANTIGATSPFSITGGYNIHQPPNYLYNIELFLPVRGLPVTPGAKPVTTYDPPAS